MLQFKVKLLNGITYLRGAAWIKIDSLLIVRSLRLQKRRHYWKSAGKLVLFGIWMSCGSPEATSSFLPATPGKALDSASNKHYPVGNSRLMFYIDYMLTAGRSLTWTFQKLSVWAQYPFLITNQIPNLGHYTILSDKGDLKLHSQSP